MSSSSRSSSSRRPPTQNYALFDRALVVRFVLVALLEPPMSAVPNLLVIVPLARLLGLRAGVNVCVCVCREHDVSMAEARRRGAPESMHNVT